MTRQVIITIIITLKFETEIKMKNRYSLLAIGAGIFWGTMGFFRRTLDYMGVSAMGVIAVRCLFGGAVFAAVMLIKDRNAFKVKLKDAWIFLCSGIISLLVFGWCYFRAMDEMSLSAAAILLYTAPFFVIIMSAPLFKEKLTGRKLAAMALAFAGCCLVSGIGSGGGHITLLGLALGIGSGICYALYSIFSRIAINRGYSTFTINFYSCALATLGAVIIDGTGGYEIAFSSAANFLYAVGTGVITCFMPYMLYTKSLVGLENGKASIMASIEPVVATILGFLIYSEKPTPLSIAGIILVLSAIVMLNIKNKKAEI